MRTRAIALLPLSIAAVIATWAVALGVGSVPAYADVIFSDFGPGNSYSTFFYPVCSTCPSSVGLPLGPFSFGATFTPANTFTFSDISLALLNVSGTNSLTVTLANNNSGVPGTALESWNLTNLASPPGSVLTVSSVGGVTLAENTQYWITATPGAPVTFDGWFLNNQGVTGLSEQTNGGTLTVLPNAKLPAFDVTGTLSAIPEPSTFAQMVPAMLGLVYFLRRRNPR